MIRAVIFDLGGTLEDVYYDDPLRLQAMPGLQAILAQHHLDPELPPADLYAVIKTGMHRYSRWREQTEQELSPERVWTEFIFSEIDLPKEKLSAIGEALSFYWDAQCARRTMRPEAATALAALRQRGYPLGVISNILSRELVPLKLHEYGIADYFQIILTSCTFGWRKPHPSIFVEMARQLCVQPAECAYVGDTISRDVIGARRAGYGLAIQIKSFLTTQADRETDVELPDVVIQNLSEIIQVLHVPQEQS